MSDSQKMVERIRTAYRTQGLMRSADLLALCDSVEEQGARAEKAEAELAGTLRGVAVIEAQRDQARARLAEAIGAEERAVAQWADLRDEFEAERIAELKQIRPEVLAFAHLMETKLREHDDRPGWKGWAPYRLLERMTEERRELGRAVKKWRRGENYDGQAELAKCSTCAGNGKWAESGEDCPDCNGTGKTGLSG